MALRKHGNVWCIYYNENGRRIERSLGVSDRRTAAFLERQIMSRRRLERACRRLHIVPDTSPDSGRVRIDAMLEIAGRHRKVSREAGIYFRRFAESCGMTYADECTPKRCQEWLDANFTGRSSKTYNNVKTCLNIIFRACFGETGVESPFGQLLNRVDNSTVHHRTYSQEELSRILAECTPAWRFLVTVAVNTGMSKETAIRFSPSWLEVRDGVTWARFTRSKTARFGRQCLVPLRQELLDALPKVGGDAPFLSAFGGMSAHERENGFQRVLERAGVCDTADGRADFHSLRATFITRCRERGIAEHAIRSMVGHVDSATTDVYSHDMESPLALLKDVDTGV